MTVDLEHFQPSFGTAVHLNVRCLVGLHGSVQDDDLDEAFSAVLEDAGDELDLLHYALGADEADRVQFLVGSQSLKPNASQVTLVTLYESDEAHPSHLVKQAFVHPDGEVIGLVALAARPDWFVSVYSTYSADRPELRTGARVWRLPPVTLADGFSASPPNTVSVGLNDAVPEPPNSSSNTLEYVTTLPLDSYCGIRKIASHPSTGCADLACIVGPPVDTSPSRTNFSSPINCATSHLVILQAPSKSGSGDYQVACRAQLCLPPSSQVFTSYLKTNLSHLFKTLHSSGQVAVTSPPNTVRWSSYQQAGQLAVAFESGVLGWDVRSMKPCFWLEAAHWPCVRDLDFNPHRPNLLATGGDDGCIRLWDLRYLKSKLCPTNRPKSLRSSDTTKWFPGMFDSSESSTEPLYSVQAHSHWVWSVRYHPTRDQLLLSSGSDCRVCLHNMSTFSSDALLDSALEPTRNTVRVKEADNEDRTRSSRSSSASEPAIPNRMKNGLIARLEQHEESVYAADWSPVDPWFFASVSYDGNLLVNQVPEPVKLDILLQSREVDEEEE